MITNSIKGDISAADTLMGIFGMRRCDVQRSNEMWRDCDVDHMRIFYRDMWE